MKSCLHIVSLGGSVMIPDQIDEIFIESFVRFIEKKIESGHSFIIFCGGGKVCRQYIQAFNHITNALGLKDVNHNGDHVAISVTYANATLLFQLFSVLKNKKIKLYPKLILHPKQKIQKKYNLAIGCGYEPGRSTDFCTAFSSKTHGHNSMINVSNIDYVFDKDPRMAKDARALTHVSWPQFIDIIGVSSWTPGLNLPVDPVASQFCAKHQISVKILNGNNLTNLDAVIEGRDFKGTIISHDESVRKAYK